MEHVIGWRLHNVSVRMGFNDKTSLLYPPICTPYLYMFTLTLLPFVYLPSFGHSTVFLVSSVVHSLDVFIFMLWKFCSTYFITKAFFFYLLFIYLFRRNNFPEVFQFQIISLTSLLSSGLLCCIFLQKCTDVSEEQVFHSDCCAYVLCLVVMW